MMMIIAASVQLDYIKTNWRTLAGNAAVLAEMRETGAEVTVTVTVCPYYDCYWCR